MKLKRTLVISGLLLGLSFAFVGCSGGGGGGGGTVTPTTTTVSTTSVSGTTGSTSTTSTPAPSRAISTSATTTTVAEGTATLIIDSNANGSFEDSDDLRYSVAVTNGSFSFDEVSLGDLNTTKALLTVEKEGYAPYTKVLTLTKDNAVSVLAEIGSKPILTEVIDLSSLSASARASSFVKFGVKEGANGVESFSKLMSLSEFKAEADLNLSQDGTVSESVIPTGAFPSGVQSVTANMQSFDSSNPDDFTYFPGALSGHGKPGVTASATTDTEVGLESAGFDMIKLSDQDGNHIDLQSVATSKLSAMAGTAVCNGMSWTRYLHSGEVGIIKGWGDDDNDSSNGYQVPIWSNDNSTGSWQYVGLADVYNLDGTRPYFKACVDKKWQGYLNCDSPLATTRPQQICVSAHDQFGNAIGGMNIYGKKGGSYSSAYLSNYGSTKGTGIIEVRDSNITGWAYQYRSALTGWSYVDVDPSTIVANATSTDCDYDMNISVENPYTSVVHVKAYAIDDVNYTTPLTNVGVRLYNGEYANYYSKYAYTDANGTATFEVKPNVQYKVTYKAGEANVTADGSVVAPETSDNTRDVYVNVKDMNKAPKVYVGVYSYHITDKTKTMKFSVSARDDNRDPLTFNGMTLDNTPLVEGQDYNVSYRRSYDGYYYINGVMDLQSPTLLGITPSLAANSATGYYTLKANVTDTKVVGTDDSNFRVSANQAPTIGSVYLRTNNRTYYQTSRNIPEGNFTISVNIYDRDGDSFTKTIKVDGVDYNNSVALTKGDHTIAITATDEHNNTSSKSFTIYTGNHAPVISSAGATTYYASQGTQFKLYAYVNDAEYDTLTVTATDEGNNTYTLSRVYGNTYRSAYITMGASSKSFGIVANDGQDSSARVDVNVTVNQAPTITKAVAAVNLFTGDSHTFTCSATDPEGTTVSYDWRIDNTLVKYRSYTGSLTKVFTYAGDYNVTCTAYDRDGNTAKSSATAHVTVNKAPVFDTNLSDVQVYKDTTKTFTCSAKDPEGGAVSYAWKLDGQTQTATGTTFTHTFSIVHNYTLSCTASDPQGKTATTTAKVNVVENNVPTFDTPLSNVQLDLNESHTFTCIASDPEKTAITYGWTLDSTPLSVTGTTYTTSFATEGTHALVCTATDADGKAAQSSATITVKQDMPPVFQTPLSDITVDVNKSHTFNCVANDPEGTTVTYVWKLDGVDVNSTTTSLTQTFMATGTHTISCTATDGKGKSATSSATITVVLENKVPVFTTPLTSATIDVNTAHTFTCVASDPEGTNITYSWSLAGVTQSATGTTLSHTFTTTGSYPLSCTATDADGKSATSSVVVVVRDPSVTGTLSIHTGYQGLKVTRHDIATFGLLEEKTTDVNGDASFSVTGDRTSFGIAVWPGMVINSKLVMEMTKQDLEYKAQNACYANPAPATQCATADWCAMSQTNTIEDWVWDVSRDTNDTRPLAVYVDTNPADGVISETELYNGALALLDANSDGKLTISELNGQTKTIIIEMYANVPVRSYNINFVPTDMEQQYHTGSSCSDNLDFNVTITGVDANMTHNVGASGSGSANGYDLTSSADGTLVVPIYTYEADANGNYTYLLRGKSTTETKYNYALINGKTKTELQNGITLNASSFGQADTNVTVVNQGNDKLRISARANGLSVDVTDNYIYPEYNATQSFLYYTNAGFIYSINTESPYRSINGFSIYKGSSNYYTTNTLASSYNSANYPNLDVNVSTDGNMSISGSDVSKVNATNYTFNASAYDSNTSSSSSLKVDVYWTVTPSQVPDVNLTSILPQDMVADVSAVLMNATSTSNNLYLEDFKDINDETTLIDTVAGTNPVDSSTFGHRYLQAYQYQYSSTFSSLSSTKDGSNVKHVPIFRIGYDSLFTK